jgi:Methylamine utilisation protein MauE
VIDPVASVLLRVLLGVLFASAALAKLRDLRGFATAVAGYRLLPKILAGPAAAGFVAAELALASALWLPSLRAAAAIGAASLLTLYAFAVALNLLRGRRDIDCGCGGPFGRQRLSEGLVLRNLGLAAAALACALPVAPRALSWLDAVTLAAAVAAASALYAATEVLLAAAGARRAALREASVR